MDFDGYDTLTLSNDEKNLLGTLRRLSDMDKVEYAAAVSGSWVSDCFTDYQPNGVRIPPEIHALNNFALYHAHTNKTLLSVQDLRLLLNPQIMKIVVITSDRNVCAASVGNGYRPDSDEFALAVKQIQRSIDMSLLDVPNFFQWTKEERFAYYTMEQCYQIARSFDWRIEGGDCCVSESIL